MKVAEYRSRRRRRPRRRRRRRVRGRAQLSAATRGAPRTNEIALAPHDGGANARQRRPGARRRVLGPDTLAAGPCAGAVVQGRTTCSGDWPSAVGRQPFARPFASAAALAAQPFRQRHNVLVLSLAKKAAGINLTCSSQVFVNHSQIKTSVVFGRGIRL